MSEPILRALVLLFALISDIHRDTIISGRAKSIVRLFFSKHLNKEQVEKYMKIFEEHLEHYSSAQIDKDSTKDRKRISLNAMRILSICERINEELQQKQKIYVLVKLIDYISFASETTENELDFLQTVADAFFVSPSEYNDISGFILKGSEAVTGKDKLLVIDNSVSGSREFRHISDSNIRGTLVFMKIASTNTFIMRYYGSEDLYLNGQIIPAGETCIFDHGSSVRGPGINPIYYSEVVSLISEKSEAMKVEFCANGVSFRFRKSENGIQYLDFREESGKLVGIMGSSGSGKSTAMSILNGTLRPDKGQVLINGYSLYDQDDRSFLSGLIGYVPQDDLLIEELTVYQNLYYNARMCLSNLSEDRIAEAVEHTLSDLELEDISDLKVGSVLNKVISGGQRKKLNIALELIREPTVLFVDEPTSGLSSIDSEMVMSLLKDQAYKGRLVIVNIHQPGSDLYKMFDKIMIIDKGGYQIYYGNPTEALIYFKIHSSHANPDEDQCPVCGNINTDQILRIVETKVVNEQGKPTRVRKTSPVEWAEKYRETTQDNGKQLPTEKSPIPQNNYSIPGIIQQIRIFFTRDLLSKLADKQYIFLSLLGPPLLAFLLSYFTRHSEDQTYKFFRNDNIPAYLFMCVITSLFFGLMISSEEIIRDRKILKRESFLNLSWFSYMNSKILVMFIISAIQTLSFVLIGNTVLQIRGMTFNYWLVLFTTSCFANILGLNISSAFKSVITIYILIPFILIPQLLFSGVMVKFDKLNLNRNNPQEYVPLLGDLMTARWSFEALAVVQFKQNRYKRHFIDYEIAANPSTYYATFLIDKLSEDLMEALKYDQMGGRDEIVNDDLSRIKYYMTYLSSGAGIRLPEALISSLSPGRLDSAAVEETKASLGAMKRKYRLISNRIIEKREAVMDSLIRAIGVEGMIRLKEEYENERLNFFVLNEDNTRMTLEKGDRLIQRYKPGYMKAVSRIGRAHFYAPIKRILNLEIDTYWFNILILWLLSACLYISLYLKLPEAIINLIELRRLRKSL